MPIAVYQKSSERTCDRDLTKISNAMVPLVNIHKDIFTETFLQVIVAEVSIAKEHDVAK